MRATDEDPIRQTTYSRGINTKAFVNPITRVGRPRGVWADEACRLAWRATTEELDMEDVDTGYDSGDEAQNAELHFRAQLFMF